MFDEIFFNVFLPVGGVTLLWLLSAGLSALWMERRRKQPRQRIWRRIARKLFFSRDAIVWRGALRESEHELMWAQYYLKCEQNDLKEWEKEARRRYWENAKLKRDLIELKIQRAKLGRLLAQKKVRLP